MATQYTTPESFINVIVEAGYAVADHGVMAGQRIEWKNDLGVPMGEWLEQAGFTKEDRTLQGHYAWVDTENGREKKFIQPTKQLFTNGLITISHVDDSEYVDIWDNE